MKQPRDSYITRGHPGKWLAVWHEHGSSHRKEFASIEAAELFLKKKRDPGPKAQFPLPDILPPTNNRRRK